MKVVVCGLGHLGSVAAACLLKQGHTVVGYDIDNRTRDRIARGLAPVKEPGIAELLAAGHAAGRLSAAADLVDLADADVAIVCVGTPAAADGAPDLSDVRAVTRSIGAALRRRALGDAPLALVFRSTMLPGSMTNTVLPLLVRAAGEPPGKRYELFYHPDFSRQGHAVADYFSPPKIVIGEREGGAARLLQSLHAGIEAPRFTTTFALAELAKYSDNVFHALKVTFANELGRIALRSGVEPAMLLDIFLADTKLNVSPAYLRPGGAFGGPCLPKDVRALAAHANEIGVAAPVIGRILDSNSQHVEFLVAEIARRARAGGRILLLGLTFKTGTDDLRDSPLVDVALALLDRGYPLAIHDPDLADAHAALPPRLRAVVQPELTVADGFDLIVIAKNDPRLTGAIDTRVPAFNIDRL